MKIRRILAALVGAIAMMPAAAHADLLGTSMDLELKQSGLAGDLAGPTGGSYMYGSFETFDLDGAFFWDALSPAGHPLYDNSVLLDFTDFLYGAYTVLGPSTSTLNVTGLADAPADGSPAVFLLSNLFGDIATSSSVAGNDFTVTWDVGMVVDDNPAAPAVMVAWNSAPVPTPGALALLGVAGLTVGRRRRRN